jgi:phosphate transport system substrate-binding protein
VRSTGSDTAKDAIVDKVAQIGMSSRVYTDGEIQVLAKAAGAALAARSEIEQVVALDAVVVVVNKQNPVGALNLCQIAEIFAGRIRNWRELGGRPGAINLQVRLGPSGTFETFQTLVLKACGVELARTMAFSHGSYAALLAAVAADEMSVGFAPQGFDRRKREGTAAARRVRHRADRQRVQHQDRGLSTRPTPVHLHALSARRLFAAAGEFHQGRRSRR